MPPGEFDSLSRSDLLDALVASRAVRAREAARQARLLVELRAREPEFERIGVDPVAADDLGRRGGWAAEAAFDSGRRAELAHRSLVAEVATTIRESEGVVARDFDEAERLVRRLPRTLASLDAGRIGERHARVLVEQSIGLGAHVTDRDPRDAARRLAAFEREAVPIAEETNPRGVRRRAQRIRERLLPESIDVRARRAVADRRVVLENADDGMAWLHHYLPAHEAHAAYERLTRLARREARRGARGGAGGAPSGDDAAAGAGGGRGEVRRTLTQLRADAARDLLLGGATTGVGESSVIRPTVHVTVPVLTLLGASDEPAVLDGYGPIDADSARRLSAHAPSFTRLLTHPETGVVLSVGRDSYAVPADLKRFVILRDGTCRFPGCGRSARECEIDHTVAWAAGGGTSHDNLAALCPNHHHLKHETGWTARTRGGPGLDRAGGSLEWTSPTGRTYSSEPDPP
jgi:hypothetical protein